MPTRTSAAAAISRTPIDRMGSGQSQEPSTMARLGAAASYLTGEALETYGWASQWTTWTAQCRR